MSLRGAKVKRLSKPKKPAGHKEIEYTYVRDAVREEFKKFYESEENRKQFRDVVNWFQHWAPSLRALDPILTKMICEENVCYMLPSKTDDEQTCVNLLSIYDKMIRQYSKILFDLFGRHTSLSWVLEPGDLDDKGKEKQWETTYCQFNYFKFLTEYDILARFQPYLPQKRRKLEKSAEERMYVTPVANASNFDYELSIAAADEDDEAEEKETKSSDDESKVGKNYYMRRRKNNGSEAILFAHPFVRYTPPPVPTDAFVIRPVYQQDEWSQKCMKDLEFTHSIHPIQCGFKDMTRFVMPTRDDLGLPREDNPTTISLPAAQQ